MNDREFVEWATAGYKLGSHSYHTWERLNIIAANPNIPYPDYWPIRNWQLLCLIASLRLDLADRDKQVAELSVSGGELIGRWHTALDQRDEAGDALAAAELRIAEVRKASVLAREAAVFIGMVAPITINVSDCLDEAKTKLRELSRILSALSEERET